MPSGPRSPIAPPFSFRFVCLHVFGWPSHSQLQTKPKTLGTAHGPRSLARRWVLGHPVSGQAAPTTGERAGAGAIAIEAQHCATSFREVHAVGVARGRYQAHARRVNDFHHLATSVRESVVVSC